MTGISDLDARQFVPQDTAAILEVFDSNVPEFFSVEERAAFEAFLRDLPGPYYVVEDRSGRVLACGGYAIVAEDARADLCWGMVHRAHHGKRIGRFLTELRINAVRADRRVKQVILNTSQHTRAFYERLGFVTERVSVDGFAPGLDRCDMRLPMKPGT